MKPRIFVASLALHAGLVAGAVAWIGTPAAAAPLHPARLAFAPHEASVASSAEAPPPPTFDVETPPDLDVHWQPTVAERTFEAQDFLPAPAPRPEIDTREAPTVAPASPRARIHRPPPPEPVPVETTATEPTTEAAVAAPQSSFVEAQSIPSENDKPEYPREALLRGWAGTVVLRFAIAADGTITEISVLRPSRHVVLDRAALAAAVHWRFVPAQRDGAPIASVKDVPIEFRLVDR